MSAILMYHSIVDDISDEFSENRPQTVAKHIEWLCSLGYEIVPLDVLLESQEEMNASLTFDDAYRDFFKIIPTLMDQNAPATLFACPGDLGGNNYWTENGCGEKILLTPSELRTLQQHDDLIKIELHGWKHVRMTELKKDVLDENLKMACEWFHQELQYSPDIVAYPYGSVNLEVANVVAKYAKFGITVEVPDLSIPKIRRVPRIPAVEIMSFDWLEEQCIMKDIVGF